MKLWQSCPTFLPHDILFKLFSVFIFLVILQESSY
jgi:hypothetical protein